MKTPLNLVNLKKNGFKKVLLNFLSVFVIMLFILLAYGSDDSNKSTKSTTDNTGAILLGLAGIVVVITIIALVWRANKIDRLKREYEDALTRTDKQAALLAGRRYYEFAKPNYNGEQAINNDIAAMDDARKNS